MLMIKMRYDLAACFLMVALICTGQSTEAKFLHSLNAREMPQWDVTMRAVSLSAYYTWPVPILVPVACGIKTKDKAQYRTAIKSALSIGLASGLSGLTKLAVHRTRAFVDYPGYIIQRDHAGPNSFPSGHTTTAFATATSMSLSFPEWYVIAPSYVYAGFVAYSRMRLGMHYPTDVLTGAVFGTAIPLLVWKADKWIEKRRTRRRDQHKDVGEN
jgi:membrane-associated phospholipid phosphatase